MADCFILLMDLAKVWDINLPDAIRDKMMINERRMWSEDPETGHYNHVALTTEVEFARGIGNDER